MKTIYLKGDVGWEITADKIREQIDLKSTEKLRIIINSPGGFVFEAYEIYDLLTQYKGKKEMVIMPYAASAASYIVMAGNEITAFKNSIWMAHRVSSIAWGDADVMLREAEIMQSLENIIIEAYQTRIKMSKEEMMLALKNEMWLIGWEKLTDAGIIDSVIDSMDDLELSDEDKLEIEKSLTELETTDGKTNMLKMRMAKTETRMRNDNERLKNAYEKIAARLNITDLSNNDELNPANQPVENNTSTEDKKMTLQEFLESNPEAQAEYDKVLNSARDEVRTEMTNKLNADRKRLAKVLELENVELSEAAISAIEGESTVENYMEAKIKEQQEKRDNSLSKKNSPFSKLVNRQIPKDQDTTQDIQSDEDFDKETENIAKKFFPGGKK